MIDGEGSSWLLRRHRRDHRQLISSIANTRRALLDFVLKRTGVGKVTRQRMTSSAQRPSSSCMVSRTLALTATPRHGVAMKVFTVPGKWVPSGLYRYLRTSRNRWCRNCEQPPLPPSPMEGGWGEGLVELLLRIPIWRRLVVIRGAVAIRVPGILGQRFEGACQSEKSRGQRRRLPH